MANGLLGGGTVPNVLGAIQGGMDVAERFRQIRRAKELEPIQDRLQQLAIQQQEQQLAQGQSQLLDDRNKRRLSEISRFALSIKGLPLEQQKAATVRRLEDLSASVEAGEDIDATETIEFQNLLNTNPEAAQQMLQRTIEVGERSGVLRPRSLAEENLALAREKFEFNKQQFGQEYALNLQKLAAEIAESSQKPTIDLKTKLSISEKVNKLNEPARAVVSAAKNLGSFQKLSTPASKLAAVFAFMKALDPSSIVNEGEQASAQNAAGVDDRIRNYYNRLVSGEGLSDNQIQEMIDVAKSVANNRIDESEANISGLINPISSALAGDADFEKSLRAGIPERFEVTQKPKSIQDLVNQYAD